MINLFILQKGRLAQIQADTRATLEAHQPIWVDVIDPDEEELSWIKQSLNVVLPEREELGDLEASARYFEAEDGNLHIRTDFLLVDENNLSRNVRVAFVLHENMLFSIHDEDLPIFRLVRLRARMRPGSVQNAKDVLLDLYATDGEYSADSIEEIYERLEIAAKRVLGSKVTDTDAEEVLETIAREEDLNGRIRRNMMDTRRALSFLMRSRLLSNEQRVEARQILQDIDSIENHTAFLFDKLNFLMDAIVGFLNINQNKIIKIFSVVSVALMPPTLLASIWGMNFKYMPELATSFGYPIAIGTMLISAIIPLVYFRTQGWLK